MFCQGCGTEITTEGKYCPSCGTASISTASRDIPTHASVLDPSSSINASKKRSVVLALIVAVVAVIIATTLVLIAGKKIDSASSLATRTASLLGIPCHPILIAHSERSEISNQYSCDKEGINAYSLRSGVDIEHYLQENAPAYAALEYISGSHWYIQIVDQTLHRSSFSRISPIGLADDLGGSVWPKLNPTVDSQNERECNGWHSCQAITPAFLGAPTVGQTWHAALDFAICGLLEPSIPASPPSATSGLTTTGDGVLLIAPRSSSEAGKNATLGKFTSEYAGMRLTSTAVRYPGGTEFKNGQKCPAGTPDAGEMGVVRVRSWTFGKANRAGTIKPVGGHYAPGPADLKLLNGQLITVGFGPSGKALPKVSPDVELALLDAIEGISAPVPTTSVPSS
jgi:RNA polymerase subunit RPABC4/transcription elongation factor Spt4